MKPTDPEFRRAYQRIWRAARRRGLPTKGIHWELLKDGIPPKVVKAKTPEFQREYARRMAHARYHGLPTEGILDGLRREFAEAGKPFPAGRGKQGSGTKHVARARCAERETAPLLTDEDVERWAAEVNRKVKADLAKLRKQREAEEKERRVLERQERKERRAEISREWVIYRETRTCETCKHADVIGIRPSNGTKILVCSVTGLGTKATDIACAKYDEEYINAIYDI
ncbi:MAG: hypothetical protein J6Y34_01520 [Bacteroidales bacterium]|nr:hypothetical protein [Bacteroidales bacterium]